MSAAELFHTRARANEGKRLALHTPDGKPTEHWLQVRHVWSDAFTDANEVALSDVREAVLAAEGDKAKIAVAQRDAKFRLWAALVSAWSFDTECTPANVEAFLREAPQIGNVLDKFAADSAGFFGDGSNS
jgi:hypothetical protein